MRVDYREGKFMNGEKEFEGILERKFIDKEGSPKYKNRIEVKNGLLDGKSIIYSPSGEMINKTEFRAGQVISETEFKNGKLDGVSRDFFENGEVSRITHFQGGMKHGPQETYFQDGQIEHFANYSEDKKIGLELYYFQNGQKKVVVDWNTGNSFTEFYESGEMKVSFEGDKETHYFKDGSVKIEANLRNGKYEGTVKTYYQSGQLRSTASYMSGDIHGKETIYHENNEIAFKANYNHSKKEGVVQEANVRGIVKYEARYQFGQKNGPEKFYNESGEIERVKYFRKGRQLNEVPFEVWNREVKEKMMAGVIEVVPDDLERIDVKRFNEQELKESYENGDLRWQSDGRAEYNGVTGTYDTKTNTFIPDPVKYPGVIGLNEKQVERYMNNGRLKFEEDGAVVLDGLYGEFHKDTNKFEPNPNEYSNRVNFYDEKMLDLQAEMPPYFCEADIEGMKEPPDWISPELAEIFPKLNDYQRERLIDRMFHDEQHFALRNDMKNTFRFSM